MSNMHRIGWFDQQVRAGRYPNSALLAQQFEISRRQAARDIEYMETSLRAPLHYDAKHRGYCYEDMTYVLPYVYMTDEEKRVLQYLAQRYRHYDYDHAEQVRRVADLLDRFSEPDTQGGTPLDGVPLFHVEPHKLQHIEQIRYALASSLSLHLRYRDQKGERWMHIRPLKLFTRYHADYVLAFSLETQQQLRLRLDGIAQVTVGSPCEPTGTEASSGVDGCCEESGLPLRAPYIATLKLPVSVQIADGTWMGYRIDRQEGSVYSVCFYDPNSFLQHLLLADWEELQSPRWLKQRLEQRCRLIAQRLGADN